MLATRMKIAASDAGSGNGGGGGEDTDYMLQATWQSAGDQSYADAQLLDSAAEGVEVGKLTVVMVDGSFDVVSNVLEVTGQTTAANGDLGFYSQPIIRQMGVGIVATLKNTVLTGHLAPFWKNGASANLTITGGSRLSLQLGAELAAGYVNANAINVDDGIVGNTQYQIAIIRGGYDKFGDIYYSNKGGGTGIHYAGYAGFIKGGVFTTWTLVFKTGAESTVHRPVWYASLSNFGNDSVIYKYEIPNINLSEVINPSNYFLSLFNDTNGTGLDAYTPDAGSGWTEQAGNWEIQSNAAKTASASGAGTTTIDVGVTDYIIDAKVTIPASGTIEAGIVFRYVDENNHWRVPIERVLGRYRLEEINGGGTTNRINAVQSWTLGATYRLRIIVTGALRVTIWRDDVLIGTYSATNTHAQASTLVGFYDEGDANMIFEQIAVFPATHTNYDTLLDYGATTESPMLPASVTDLSDDFNDGVLAPQWVPNEEGTSYVIEQNNRLEMVAAGTDHVIVTTEYTYLLTGDFDVQVDFTRTSSSGWISLRLMTPNLLSVPEEEARMIFRDAGGVYGFEIRHDQLPATLDGSGTYTGNTSDTAGKLRVTRSGTTVEGFYWNGSSWTSIDTGTVDADDMGIELWMTEAAEGYFDNLVVNSGTVVRVLVNEYV